MTNKLFERYEIKNGANLEFFFDYKEALKRAEELNKDLCLVLYNYKKEAIEKTIVNKVGKASDIKYIVVQKIINNVQYEHVYEANNVHKSSYNEVTDNGDSLDKNIKLNLNKIYKRLSHAKKHGVNYYIIYKDGSQNGVCLSEYNLLELNKLF
jgi:hypothetical protein